MNKRAGNQKAEIRGRKPEIFSALAAALCFTASLLILGTACVAGAAVKGNLADACFKCHPKLKEGLSQSTVHFPFKQGKCEACHDMHASNSKGLVKDDIKTLCLSCHEDIRNMVQKANLHSALKRGVCTDCHLSHSSNNKHLLAKPGKDLCWTCHEKLKAQLNKPDAHAPFKNGECAACHNPHGSSERGHLVAAANKVCRSCHAPRCKANNGVSIASFTKDMDCVSCHTGHSSDTKGLLGPYGHSAFITKNCEQCHNPFVENRRAATKADGEKLCFMCHQNDPAKFRANDVHKGDGKNACAMCHNYHASKKKKLTVDETGLCITCHTATEKRMLSMEKALKNVRCAPIKDRKCFECHMPLHSGQPHYFKQDVITTCAKCHETQHKITHPLGKGTIDPRNNQMMTCASCHSMHAGKAEYMLAFDRKRQLCIQCHKK